MEGKRLLLGAAQQWPSRGTRLQGPEWSVFMGKRLASKPGSEWKTCVEFPHTDIENIPDAVRGKAGTCKAACSESSVPLESQLTLGRSRRYLLQSSSFGRECARVELISRFRTSFIKTTPFIYVLVDFFSHFSDCICCSALTHPNKKSNIVKLLLVQVCYMEIWLGDATHVPMHKMSPCFQIS